jgi:hypothetical protein
MAATPKRTSQNGDLPAVDQLGRYIAARVGASSGDQPCRMIEGPRPDDPRGQPVPARFINILK